MIMVPSEIKYTTVVQMCHYCTDIHIHALKITVMLGTSYCILPQYHIHLPVYKHKGSIPMNSCAILSFCECRTVPEPKVEQNNNKHLNMVAMTVNLSPLRPSFFKLNALSVC